MNTLYELKQNMATVGQQLQKTEGELAKKAIDPSASMKDIQNLQKSKDDLKARFDVIKDQHDKMEAEQKAAFQSKDDIKNIIDPNEQKMKAKADMIKAVMSNKPVPADVKQALGDDNSTGGEKFIPKTVSNDVIVEPLVNNQLRGLSTFTQVTNLGLAKINFPLDDDDFVEDTETAKELEAKVDTVSFGRNKFKVFAGISETVL